MNTLSSAEQAVNPAGSPAGNADAGSAPASQTEIGSAGESSESPSARRRLHLYALVGIGLLAVGAAIVWFWGEPIWRLLTDEQAIETLVARAGIWGPLALIGINILQIVVAPIPGYVVQLAAGYLYGPLWGGIYAAIGTLAGAMAGMFLARTFGRPLAIWMLGKERLARWEVVTHSDSPWVWILLIVAPLGDSVFLLAGLSRVSYLTIFIIALVVRVPSVFLSTAIGGGAVPVVWMVVLVTVVGTLTAVAYRYRATLSDWFERTVKEKAIQSSGHPGPGLTLTPVATDTTMDEAMPEPVHLHESHHAQRAA